MTPEQQRIIVKVKKLLALAKNNIFPGEAEAAALKAQELLHKYNLKLAAAPQQENDPAGVFVPQEAAPDPTRLFVCSEHVVALREQWLPSWVKLLANGVSDVFDVESVRGLQGCYVVVVFIGVEPDVSVACQLFAYLYNFVSSCPLAGRSSGEKNDWRLGFAVGCAQRLLERKELLQGDADGKGALMLAKDAVTKKYICENYFNLYHSRRRLSGPINARNAALLEGLNAGRCVNLQGAMSAS